MIGIPEGEERIKSMESLFKGIIEENFADITRHPDTQIEDGLQTPGRFIANSTSLRHRNTATERQ